jgi:hypothetical protein
MEMTWNQETERLDAMVALEDAPPNEAVALLVDARKRAFVAEHKAQQLHTELDALKAAHAWIKTSERMPDPGVKVLILCTDRFIAGEARIAKYYRTDDGTIEWSDDSIVSEYSDIDSKHVVAWMPRPQGEL